MNEPVAASTASVPRVRDPVGTAFTRLALQGVMASRSAIGLRNCMRHALNAELC